MTAYGNNFRLPRFSVEKDMIENLNHLIEEMVQDQKMCILMISIYDICTIV